MAVWFGVVLFLPVEFAADVIGFIGQPFVDLSEPGDERLGFLMREAGHTHDARKIVHCGRR